MLTLSTATSEVKNIAKWGGIVIGILTIFWLMFNLIHNYIQSRTPPPPPTVTFGKLPLISFPQNFVTQPTTYTVDTITGQLPASGKLPGQFPDRLGVYKLIKNTANLLALQNATAKVAQVNFKDTPTALSQTLYQWVDQTPPYRKLTLDILTFNFSLSSSFLTDPDILSAHALSDQGSTIIAAQSFLTSIAGFADDIDSSLTKTQLITIQNGTLIPATSFSTTQLVQVNFFQKAVDNLSVFYPQGNGSPMQFLVGSGTQDAQVVDAHYTHQTIGKDSATYPIKTATQAFSDLQNGSAFIAMNSGNKQGVSIRQVSLGYYIGTEEQTYLLPIVVFSGDGFLAYVPAITDQWTEK